MSNPYFDDPLPDHLADTGPVQAIRDGGRAEPLPAWRRAFGFLSLLGATVLTAGAVFITIAPTPTPAPPIVPSQQAAAQDASPVPPTATPVENTENTTNQEIVNPYAALPTLDPARIAEMLSSPMQAAPAGDSAAVRNIYEPFTIIPERSRSGVEAYTIATGDTIFSLAERYGLQPETIVWGNDHTLVEGLRPGRVINILPVDGVYHVADGDETIAQIAAQYQAEPYDIIDSEFNDLFGMTPNSVVPEGTEIVIPGGEREQIAWNPLVERVAAGTAGAASGANGAISFAPGEPGSCGLVTNPGGTVWVRPLSGYQWIRGFSGVHSGVDLSAPAGTPVSAANGGSVIFAGWNNYGYGYAVVLAHGPYTTLYGHLSSISVGCAQYVQAGDIIGAVGSSGQSSGSHLHFEIRYLDTPTDPTGTMAL